MCPHSRLPEQEKKAVDLQHNTNNWPADQDHKHTSQKEACGFKFVPLEKESEGALQADDK